MSFAERFKLAGYAVILFFAANVAEGQEKIKTKPVESANKASSRAPSTEAIVAFLNRFFEQQEHISMYVGGNFGTAFSFDVYSDISTVIDADGCKLRKSYLKEVNGSSGVDKAKTKIVTGIDLRNVDQSLMKVELLEFFREGSSDSSSGHTVTLSLRCSKEAGKCIDSDTSAIWVRIIPSPGQFVQPTLSSAREISIQWVNKEIHKEEPQAVLRAFSDLAVRCGAKQGPINPYSK